MTDLPDPVVPAHGACVAVERDLLQRIAAADTRTIELTGVRDRLDAELAATKQQLARVREDFNIVADALRDEAVRRQWCEDYERFVRDVNEMTDDLKLTSRARTFRVEHTYTVRIHGEVSALDLDDAQALAYRQYGGIREAYFFNQPDDVDSDMLPDEGTLTELGWTHDTSIVTEEEE